jgi:hypothetical protein
VTSPGRSAPTPSPPDADDPRARTIGIALIAAALLIGIVLLAKGFSQEDSLVATGVPDTDRTTTTTSATGGAVEETTTTTAAVANPPASVSVIVANGTGTTGVAGTNAEKLTAAGYTDVETTNAPTSTRSNVYFAAGAQADAQAVATALSLDQASVQAMPTPPPVELAGATVLVIIGSDRA